MSELLCETCINWTRHSRVRQTVNPNLKKDAVGNYISKRRGSEEDYMACTAEIPHQFLVENKCEDYKEKKGKENE